MLPSSPPAQLARREIAANAFADVRKMGYELMMAEFRKSRGPDRLSGHETEKTHKGGRVAARDRRISARLSPSRIFENTSLTFVDNNLFEIIRRQREGLPLKVISVMSRKLDMNVDAFTTALSLPRNIKKSRFMRGKNLPPLAAERVIRAARILKRATEVFESEQDACIWLKLRNRALGGKMPLSYMDTGAGFHHVGDELKRIEYGLVA